MSTTNSSGNREGRQVPAANPSSAYPSKAIPPVAAPLPQPGAKAKPPVVAGGIPAAAPAPLPPLPAGPVGFPPPGMQTPAPQPQKPPPPVKTPRNAKGLGMIIGLAIALPICFLLACGVGGYLLYSTALSKAKTAVASRSGKSGAKVKVDPNNPFAALESPEMQKEMEKAFGKAFDQMDAEMKKQGGSSSKSRPGRTRPTPTNNNGGAAPNNPFANIPMPPPMPREADKDDYPTNLKRLQTGNDDEKRRAADWFSRAPLEVDKQDEVAKALNTMHTDSLRKHALGALKVWGTAENVPMISRIMQQEAFVKIDCMTLLEKFKDERAIEPLITVLNEAFGEGDRAEELLADWWPQAEAPLIKHLNSKEGRLRERTLRILELRKTDPSLLAAQSLTDLDSGDREVRRNAISWLAKAEIPAESQPPVAAAAQKLVDDANVEIRRGAVELFGKYAQKEQADDLLKLVDDNQHERWKAGLAGLIRLEDVRVGEKIGRRKEIRGEAFRMLREAGAPAQDIVVKTLTNIEVKDWGAGKELCEILGEIGTLKSVGFLQQVKKKAVAAKTPFVGEAADKAIEDIRRRNK